MEGCSSKDIWTAQIGLAYENEQTKKDTKLSRKGRMDLGRSDRINVIKIHMYEGLVWSSQKTVAKAQHREKSEQRSQMVC